MNQLTFLIFTVISLIYIAPIFGQDLHIQTYGNPTDPTIIYLHGGPGYNSVAFERTAAEELSKAGFFVINYDRRGEGRSTDDKANFSFKETFKDLNRIYKQYKLKKATLVGHSFGGLVGTLYSEKYKSKVKALVLLSSPIDFQESFKHILQRAKSIYAKKEMSVQMGMIEAIGKMDTSSLIYSSSCFMHAIQTDAYSPKSPTDEAKEILEKMKTDEIILKYGAKMTQAPVYGFWDNEAYTTINLKPNLKKLFEQKTTIYAIYGKEDGLFSRQQVEDLYKIIGEENVKYLDNCSHNPFIDQQSEFIQVLSTWLK
ncbi:MAG: alpha/beta hydrolase [Saprospiraceae bacterium]|nr:alpha/beta hydrolase [Saprospiraceae bacterium]